MENWEFLLQRKGDKSWLPLESPTVEILEGQYRLAARSALANALVGIAIAYRPLADVRHQPLQQKIAKRISHDGLLIVMPYTNFVPGIWQIDCIATESGSESANTNLIPAWKKTVKFDVIQISAEAGSDWQYNEVEEDLETPAELANESHTNALGIIQTEPTPLSYSSPILDIAEQRSTELVASMFEEFALFNDEDEEIDSNSQDLESETESLRDRPNLIEQVEAYGSNVLTDADADAPLQPRILLRLKQPQYILNEDNSFNLTGEVYTQGEIEVSLKDPQTLDVLVNQRFEIARISDRNPATGAMTFTYQIIVPPPSEIQVLIGEVQIHPQQDFQQDSDLYVTQQAIAVSYPASRVLPELIKEAQKYSPQETTPNSQTKNTSSNQPSYSQFPQSFPQVSTSTENQPRSLSPKPKPANSLSLPPIPSNRAKANQAEVFKPQVPANSLSLPPLPSEQNRAINQTDNPTNPEITDDYPQSFPQVAADIPQEIESEFNLTNIGDLADSDRQIPSNYEEEPELLYSFEEELPQNYEELLENLPSPNVQPSRNRSNRFLNKLQTLSADAIAAQKANQRTEELLLDTFPPRDPLLADDLSSASTSASIDLDHPEQTPRTIAEATSLAELDLELDVELDRLLTPEPDLILNEYVWEDPIDSNTFPISTVSSQNSAASTLSETAQTIRNIQETSPQALSDQEPIPIPEILIPAGELISGTPMQVIVRLPALAPKFFVKFWIKDLQTRMIVDGPRWLLDFSTVPNAEFIETRTNISIPLSSIDVAFEAIAIEAQTQRESHKVRVTRAVTPPNLAQDTDFDEP
ncbi:hypothetical protein APA_4176 [Pseudanabaena sp. lw0831]|uniref:hypothetical protein n=1 Tax=Pseudanabaena sp. lw0831 TaxID=1357935 RepID=UPI001916AB91|nr:hypothetical protein [Pseudanabaena sp. lw0831]GBO55970.1 hypothetical protein APA_4176 [Pseudanabaena sp. lw0831]